MPPPVLERIVVYPVKGASGVSLSEARVDDFGLHLDRRWMLLDGEGVFLSQRNHPGLALLRPRIEEGALVLEAPGMEALALPPEPRGRPVAVEVWGSRAEAVEVEDAAGWIGRFLGGPGRLVFMPETAGRPVDGGDGGAGRVSFADGFPFLLVSRESLEELNRRLAEPVPMNRFRPNLVVGGEGPHAEDRWRRVRIGEIGFDVAKPCARCAVTTVDQATGRRGEEPLRTLAEYRKHEGKTWFGQNLVHRGGGTLRVGDPVEVLEAGSARPRIDLAKTGR